MAAFEVNLSSEIYRPENPGNLPFSCALELHQTLGPKSWEFLPENWEPSMFYKFLNTMENLSQNTVPLYFVGHMIIITQIYLKQLYDEVFHFHLK